MGEKRFKILVVEDDTGFRDILKELLSQRYQVVTAGDGEEGIAKARSEMPDLVLLDIGLPKRDGMSVCEELRTNSRTSEIPVMMVSGNSDVERRIMSFEAGADDYVTKPFNPQELIARIESKIRRFAKGADEAHGVLRCGNLDLDMARLEVRISGNVVKLSVLEFNLLRFFIENGERVVSREKILSTVWRNSFVADRTVDTHIASLRKRLGGFDHSIGTVYGAGYILKRCVKDGTSLDSHAETSRVELHS